MLYINGVRVAMSSFTPATAVSYEGVRVTFATNAGNTQAFKGYLDDVRLYNRALTPTEVYKLYAANATSTAVSNYLLPRSYVYQTPVIAPGAWQKVSFVVPGDTASDAWATDSDPGVTLSLCLSGGGSSNITGATQTWLSSPAFNTTDVQTFGTSSNVFIAQPANQILITGLQLEKGNVVTPFDAKPFAIEKQLCPSKSIRYQWGINYIKNNNTYTFNPTSWTFMNLGTAPISPSATYDPSTNKLIAPFSGVWAVTINVANGNTAFTINTVCGPESKQLSGGGYYGLYYTNTFYAAKGSQLISGSGDVSFAQTNNNGVEACGYFVQLTCISRFD